MALDVMSAYDEYASKVGSANHHQQCLLRDSECWNTPTNAVYAVLQESGNLWRSSYHICFGRLNEQKNWNPTVRTDPAAVIFVQIQQKLLDKHGISDEMAHTYYEWLFNYSPYRDTFITKDHRKVLADKVVMLTADIDASLMLGACSAVRLPWESYYTEYKLPSIVHLWWELVSKGSDPTVSLALANQFNKASGSEWIIRSTKAGHQFLDIDDSNTVLSFSEGKHIGSRKFNKTHCLDEDLGITGIWKHDHAGSVSIGNYGSIKKWLNNAIVGVSGAKVNPFNSYTTPSYKLPALVEGLTAATSTIKGLINV